MELWSWSNSENTLLLSLSLYPVCQSAPVYSRYNLGRYVHTQYGTYLGGYPLRLPCPSPSPSPSPSPRTTLATKALLPPSLNTDLHLFRPCRLFFRQAQWFLLFLPPYPPFPSHTPAHFFSTSTTTDLSDYSFSLLLPYPSPNLVFVTTGFSSSSPLSLFGHVLLASSSSPSFSSRTTTHHQGLLLRTSPFRVSADPQT